MIPTIEWQGLNVRMVDQRKLPAHVQWYTCRSYKDVIRGIRDMVIRGAPAIGIAAAMGLALGARSAASRAPAKFFHEFERMSEEFLAARPTAVNLRWAVERMQTVVEHLHDSPVKKIVEALQRESTCILEEDIEINRTIGRYGAELLPDPALVMTHCNAGALATGGYGTALGVIRAAVSAGKHIRVVAGETRPWLQGLRLTSFELNTEGIPVTVIVDSAAGSMMRAGGVDAVVTGADRIASNGDVANKIGTYQLAVLARTNGIPFYVAAPLSTIDRSISSGDAIPVEMRDPSEVTRIAGKFLGPEGVEAFNPAFDVTPAEYVGAIITEKGVLRAPYEDTIAEALKIP
ncbi:MAG TPA: S-methyl-5-thioribose-1-phosphate isomerase [Desulfobacteraceae bacterium]|jgi:methylthioribose-1-phosphate isomerase|nr:S-methyl-5-thioribose-1-phosphate isomerase [Desulfobacteraceae bacterium]